ncbi:MAG TPA: hypothetical protein VFL94_10100 [Actinomycetales bacterium]|nr:hypothetical protein [Actinomycetales bacterium]
MAWSAAVNGLAEEDELEADGVCVGAGAPSPWPPVPQPAASTSNPASVTSARAAGRLVVRLVDKMAMAPPRS